MTRTKEEEGVGKNGGHDGKGEGDAKDSEEEGGEETRGKCSSESRWNLHLCASDRPTLKHKNKAASLLMP